MAKTMASLQAFPSSLLPRAWSRVLIPFPFPFERLPRRLRRPRSPRGSQSGEKGQLKSSVFSSMDVSLPPVLENAFSPCPTGSPRMDSTRLKERLRGTLQVTDRKQDLKVELT